MSLLKHTEHQELVTFLLKLPDIEDPLARRFLLAGLPSKLRYNIPGDDRPQQHIMNIVTAVDDEAAAGPYDGTWPIVTVIENGLFHIRGQELPVEADLRKWLDTAKSRAFSRASQSGQAFEQPSTNGATQGATVTSTLTLSGSEGRKLYQALLKAFPTKEKWGQMIYFRLKERMDALANNTREEIAFDLILWAAAQGRIADLIAAARSENPGDPRLRELAERIGLAPRVSSDAPDLAAVETYVVANTFFTGQYADTAQIESWLTGLSEAEATVCRIEVDSEGRGTGFLLGPSAVLTTSYMLNDAMKDKKIASDVALRFGYKASPDGKTIQQGQAYRLAKDWLLAYSPLHDLDYALIRVEGIPGDDPIGGQTGAPPRRWLTPSPQHSFQKGDPLLMIQHPKAEPIKVSTHTNSVLAVRPDGYRVAYRMQSAPGSGGSPCFTPKWEAVAIHTLSIPWEYRADREEGAWIPKEDWPVGERIKIGTPLAAIVAQQEVRAALEMK